MITEEKGLMMLAGANPVSELDQVDVNVEAAMYLATLEQRSSEVTQLDTKGQNQKEKKTAAPWLVAAAVAIVAGIGLIVVNQGNEAPLTSPVPPAATNPPVTSEAAPTTVNQEPGPVTSFDDIAGTIYRSPGTGLDQYLYFLEDGTINVSTNPDLVVDRPSDVYTTRFDGTQVLITSPGSSRCPQPDQGGTYEIHLLENGNVQFLAIDEDPCALRSGFLQLLDRDGVSAGGFVPVP